MRRRMLIIVCVLVGLTAGIVLLTTGQSTSVPFSAHGSGLLLTGVDDTVKVLAVQEHSPAQCCGIEPGDTLISIQNNTVTSVDSAEACLAGYEKPWCLTICLLRDGEELTLVLTAP